MVGDGREVGVERLLEHLAGALAADHAQQVLRRGERRIGRDRRQALLGVEQRRQEHRHARRRPGSDAASARCRAACRCPTRSASTGVRPAAAASSFGTCGEGRTRAAARPVAHGRLVAAALGVAFPQQRRDAFEAARRRPAPPGHGRARPAGPPRRRPRSSPCRRRSRRRGRYPPVSAASDSPSLFAGKVGSSKYVLSILIDIDQYISHGEGMAEFRGSGAPARRVGGDALRLCEPRAAALGGGRRPAASGATAPTTSCG